MERSRARRTGFTLVELLVVIAIITLLIAIALPVFSRARERARQTACMANLHQIAMGLRLYRVDELGYPSPYDAASGNGGLNALYPAYVPSRKVMVCPSDSVKAPADYIRQYAQLLDKAQTTYRWEDIDYFINHYSTYNPAYNWMGYSAKGGVPQICGFGAGNRAIGIGDSLASWYVWYRWDPEGVFNLTGDDWLFLDRNLYYHLGQQVYWPDYNAGTLDNAHLRLRDGLDRALWDPADPSYSYYGLPSSVFPGLANPNAPENTIVTHCPAHRRYTVKRIKTGRSGPSAADRRASSGQTRTTVQLRREESPQDIALRLDGSCELIPGLDYKWAEQPLYTGLR